MAFLTPVIFFSHKLWSFMLTRRPVGFSISETIVISLETLVFLLLSYMAEPSQLPHFSVTW